MIFLVLYIVKKFKVTINKSLDSEDIAIIGMGCRMPDNANTPDQFWDNVLSQNRYRSPKSLNPVSLGI